MLLPYRTTLHNPNVLISLCFVIFERLWLCARRLTLLCVLCVCIHTKSATSSLSVSQGPYDDMEICSAQPLIVVR